MRTRIERQLCIFWLISIIVSNKVVCVHGEIVNDVDPETIIELSDMSLIRQLMDSTIEGSGFTTSEAHTTSTTTTTTISLSNCPDESYIRLQNGTCVPFDVARNISVEIIRSNSSDSQKADALYRYFLAGGNLPNINRSDSLTPREVDNLIDNLDGIEPINNNNTIFLMSQSTENGSVIGAVSVYNSTKEIVRTTTKAEKLNANLAAAAIIHESSSDNIEKINMLILDDPKAYEHLDTSNNQLLVSSVIVLGLKKKNNAKPTTVELYFKDRKNTTERPNGQYLCSFFNTNISKWSTVGSSPPQYSKTFDYFYCTYNHTTTFALIWLPDVEQSKYLTAQDIASLVFLSISILCFIAVTIHSLINRLRNPTTSLLARDLLPLISSASTTMLFIFYIALTMTVFTRTPSIQNATQCFTSASVLMFITYFFLILMFCVKTSVGYFNYLRFVHLFPEPSFRKLFILLFISFLISITWTLFAIGFNSNPSFHITQLHGNKLCWFTRNVVYYFMTIPVSIFIFLNILLICFVGKRIVEHARRATSPHRTYERMKRCALVLLSSCVTQGLAWIFGPFITFINSDAANIFGWFFVIFVGLEGLWTVLLYLTIRSQRTHEVNRSSNTISSKISDEKQRDLKFFNDLYNGISIDIDNNVTEL